MFVISAVDSSAAVHGWCKSFQLLGLLSNVFIARMLRHRQRNDKQTNFDSVALCKVHCRENLLPKCFCVTGEKPSRILPSIKKKKPVAQDVQITLKISHSTLKTLTFLSPDLHSLRTIWHHHHQWFYLIDWKVNPRLKTGFTHLRQEDILQLLFDLNRLRSSAVWMCLRDMRVCLCVSTVLRGWMCKSKVFLLQRVCVWQIRRVFAGHSLCARVCVWLWLHDNINSLSSFVTIRLYLNRINHTSHVWHAHVHSAFDSADTYMCRPTCETLASSSRELCSHNNGQQWEQ